MNALGLGPMQGLVGARSAYVSSQIESPVKKLSARDGFIFGSPCAIFVGGRNGGELTSDVWACIPTNLGSSDGS